MRIVATPIKSIMFLQRTLQASLRPGTILVDTSNCHFTRDGHTDWLENGVPDSVWVSTNLSYPAINVFNNIIANDMVESARVRNCPQRTALPISGDDNNTISFIMSLADRIGSDAFNADSLADSWQQHGQPVYCTESNLEQLPGLLSRAYCKRHHVSAIEEGRSWTKYRRTSRHRSYTCRSGTVGMDTWRAQSWLAGWLLYS